MNYLIRKNEYAEIQGKDNLKNAEYYTCRVKLRIITTLITNLAVIGLASNVFGQTVRAPQKAPIQVQSNPYPAGSYNTRQGEPPPAVGPQFLVQPPFPAYPAGNYSAQLPPQRHGSQHQPYGAPVGGPLIPIPANNISINRETPAVPVPMAAELGKGEGFSNPLWTRGYGIYAAAWLSFSYASLSGVENKSTGILSHLELEKTSKTYYPIFTPSIAIGYNMRRYGIPYPVRLEFEFTIRNKMEYSLDSLFKNSGSIIDRINPVDYESVIKNRTWMINAYYDFEPIEKNYYPYIGIGLGWSMNNVGSIRFTDSLSRRTINSSGGTDDIAYSLMAGFTYPLAKGWLIDTRYRYTNLGSVEWGSLSASMPVAGLVIPADVTLEAKRLSLHEIGVGLRYNF